MKEIPARPSYLGGCDTDHLYLVTADDDWPVDACSTEKEAINAAKDRIAESSGSRKIRITKIAVASYTEYQMVSVPAVEKLLPKHDMIEQMEEFTT